MRDAASPLVRSASAVVSATDSNSQRRQRLDLLIIKEANAVKSAIGDVDGYGDKRPAPTGFGCELDIIGNPGTAWPGWVPRVQDFGRYSVPSIRACPRAAAEVTYTATWEFSIRPRRAGVLALHTDSFGALLEISGVVDLCRPRSIYPDPLV